MMRIRIRPSFLAYLCIIAWLSSLSAACTVLWALFVHELGHYLAARVCGEKLTSLELTPFGGVMRYAAGRSPAKGVKGIAVAAAGPAANYLMLIASSSSMIQHALGAEMIEKQIIANTSMFLMNLIPALPLDGGRIVFCLGFYIFSVSALIKTLCLLGCVVGALMAAAAAAGMMIYGMLNCSLLIVGIYLIWCALGSRDALVGENMYTVIQERISLSPIRCNKLELFAVGADRKLYELLPMIARTHAAAFFYEWEGRYCFVPERCILMEMLEHPDRSISSLEGK